MLLTRQKYSLWLGLTLLLLFSVSTFTLWATKPALAHGVVWRQAPSDQTISLHFLYSDQTPMMYSKVQLFSPAEAEIPYQSGVTDKNGGFAFIPNTPGLWKFESNDGQGHLASGEIEVVWPEATETVASGLTEQEPGSATSQPPSNPKPSPAMASGGSQAPTWDRIGLGLSVIINIALLALLFRKKNKPSAKQA
jgi:nickel transport protein